MFDERQWPEGFEFPSCDPCNSRTRQEEQVIALLSRISTETDTQQTHKEAASLLKGIRNNFPEVLDEMVPTQAQVDAAMQRYDIPRGPEALVSVDGPLVSRCRQRFGLKLGCALYYKHTRRIVPEDGGIVVRWVGNLQLGNDEVPSTLNELIPDTVQLTRSGRVLNNQFSYYFGFDDNGSTAAFYAQFRNAFTMLIGVFVGSVDEDLPDDVEVLRPSRY